MDDDANIPRPTPLREEPDAPNANYRRSVTSGWRVALGVDSLLVAPH
jgi:hypothetical protein